MRSIPVQSHLSPAMPQPAFWMPFGDAAALFEWAAGAGTRLGREIQSWHGGTEPAREFPGLALCVPPLPRRGRRETASGQCGSGPPRFRQSRCRGLPPLLPAPPTARPFPRMTHPPSSGGTGKWLLRALGSVLREPGTTGRRSASAVHRSRSATRAGDPAGPGGRRRRPSARRARRNWPSVPVSSAVAPAGSTAPRCSPTASRTSNRPW